MSTFDYDIIVIGGGGGGLTAAKLALGFGKKVLLIEKNKLGGECTWTGCVPSKTLIKTAQVAYQAQQLNTYGLKSSNAIDLDTSKVMAHIQEQIRNVYQTHTPEVLKQQGINVLFGSPAFLDNHHIQLGDQTISANKFVIATGSRPFVPPIDGMNSVKYLTNETIFNLERIPQSLIILGGGAIGAELGSAFNRLGTRVTIIEMQERILPKEDEELVVLLTDIFKKEGVKLLTGMRATKVTQQNNTITVNCADKSGAQHEVQAEQLLVAVGRQPNIDTLVLNKAGVKTIRRGIIVDTTLRTTAKNIYACGDVVGPYLFSHMAWHQAVIATQNALIPLFKKRMNYDHTIWVTFTAPELATIGLTEQAARDRYGNTISIYRRSYSDIDRGRTDRTEEGLAKFICDKKGRLIGVHILGERAGDIIHEVQLGKVHGIPFAKLQSMIHAYPTYSELIWHAAKEAYVDRLARNPFIRILKRLMKS